MDEVKRIVGQIRKGVVKPIYFLFGEEPYFIDKLSDYMAENLLTEEERGFNQTILYGKDISVEDIVASAKRYPMMAERQVIIVKEAQDMSRHIEKLVSYVEQPQPTTVLVICFKYKKLDKRKKLFKAIVKTGEVVESKKLYENQVTDWLRSNLLSDGFTISHKAAMLLVEYLGTDLGLIDNELQKLKLVLPPKTEIGPKHIEENVGISKDFNNFELTKAIGERNILKASRIITYFAQNPKDNPFVVTVSLLHQFFVRLLKYHAYPIMTQRTWPRP